MDEFPQIAFRDGALGRRVILLGMRLAVRQVLETVRDNGRSVERGRGHVPTVAPSAAGVLADAATLGLPVVGLAGTAVVGVLLGRP